MSIKVAFILVLFANVTLGTIVREVTPAFSACRAVLETLQKVPSLNIRPAMDDLNQKLYGNPTPSANQSFRPFFAHEDAVPDRSFDGLGGIRRFQLRNSFEVPVGKFGAKPLFVPVVPLTPSQMAKEQPRLGQAFAEIDKGNGLAHSLTSARDVNTFLDAVNANISGRTPIQQAVTNHSWNEETTTQLRSSILPSIIGIFGLAAGLSIGAYLSTDYFFPLTGKPHESTATRDAYSLIGTLLAGVGGVVGGLITIPDLMDRWATTAKRHGYLLNDSFGFDLFSKNLGDAQQWIGLPGVDGQQMLLLGSRDALNVYLWNANGKPLPTPKPVATGESPHNLASDKAPEIPKVDPEQGPPPPIKPVFEGDVAVENLRIQKSYATAAPLTASPTDLSSSHQLTEFVRNQNGTLIERPDIIDGIVVAVLAKEHVLLAGPPGTSKSDVANQILGGIHVDGKPSYIAVQIHREVTRGDILGPIDSQAIERDGQFRRLHDQGILGFHYGLLDEGLDAGPGATRHFLSALAERKDLMGGKAFKGILKTVVLTTNKSVAEFFGDYELVRMQPGSKPTDPMAVMDRFMFSFLTPRGFESTESNLRLTSSGRRPGEEPKYSIEETDLEALRKLTVSIPTSRSVDLAHSVLYNRIKHLEVQKQESSLAEFRAKLDAGERPETPPYRAARDFSDRSEGMGYRALKTATVYAWSKNNERELQVTFKDLALLKPFYARTGVSPGRIQQKLGGLNGTEKGERHDLSDSLHQQQLFSAELARLTDEVDNSMPMQRIAEFNAALKTADSLEAKAGLEREVIGFVRMLEANDVSLKAPIEEMGGAQVGHVLALEEAAKILAFFKQGAQ